MSFLIFFLALSLMVFVHELGHFLVAKKKGIRVEEFGFGFPPRILGKKIKGTIYSVNLLPLGGFVRVWGMEEKVTTDKEKSFYVQSKKTQALVLIAGVIMNFLMAVAVFGTIYGIKGIPQATGEIEVIEVSPGSPAENAGIKSGVVITAIITGDKTVPVKENGEFIEEIGNQPGKEVILVTKDGQQFILTPRENPPAGEGPLGVIITDSKIIKPPVWQRVPLGVWYGLKEGFFWGKNIAGGIFKIILDIFRGKAPTDVAGPIGIYKASSQIFKENGLLAVIHFFAVISVNLMVVNLLPLPGTDGWHISILGVEKLRKKRFSFEAKRKMNQVGMSVLLALFFLILIADVKRFIL